MTPEIDTTHRTIMDDKKLIALTYAMRKAQIGFSRSQDDGERRPLLRESKRLELLVDKALRERAPELEQT